MSKFKTDDYLYDNKHLNNNYDMHEYLKMLVADKLFTEDIITIDDYKKRLKKIGSYFGLDEEIKHKEYLNDMD